MAFENSLYNAAQWRWVAERYKEGYTQVELADWLEMSLYSVSQNVGICGGKLHRGRTRRPDNLPDLDSRKREFYKLWYVREEL